MAIQNHYHEQAMQDRNHTKPSQAIGELSTARQPQVNAALDHLEGSTTRIEKLVETLIGRLELISCPGDTNVNSADGKKEVRHPTALLASALNTQADRLDATSDRIALALDRLEI